MAMAVVCPKPRRYGFSLDDHFRPLRNQTSIGASRAETELLDIILAKENNGEKAVDPPFLCGSPPSRTPNPIVQDEQFHKEGVGRFRLHPISPSSARKGGCIPAKLGHQPAIIRVEGFDCSVFALA